MRALTFIFTAILGCSFLTPPVFAQVTNAWPATKLESFDTNVSVVILKATTELGAVVSDTGTVAVRRREITDTSTGYKEQGLVIDISQRTGVRDVMLIDHDEIPSLLNALDYLNKFNISITSFNFLDAEYTTKGGFHLAALGTRRTGAVQFALRNLRTSSAPVFFSRENLAQFSGLINQGKVALDSAQGK